MSTSISTQTFKPPNRFLFIASIGNPAPYTETRHSAGHILLDAIQPQLHQRIGLSVTGNKNNSSSTIFYSTWKSPSFMNVSGPAVLRQLKTWLADREAYFNNTLLTSRGQNSSSSSSSVPTTNTTPPVASNTIQLLKSSSEPIAIDIRALTQRFRPTLVILHDELEARPGQVKIRRGGPQQASLRGHRGLISIMDSLRGVGLLPSSLSSSSLKLQHQHHQRNQNNTNTSKSTTNMGILRIGIGIGRPTSREKDAVSDYVLSKMGAQELQALRDAVPEVVDALVQEMYRRDEDEV